MSDAPERIWAWHIRTQDGRWIGKHAVQDVRPNSPTATEYVRADHAQALVAAAYADRIEELEAKLAQAVDALDEAHTSILNMCYVEAYRILDAALSKLEGETNGQ